MALRLGNGRQQVSAEHLHGVPSPKVQLVREFLQVHFVQPQGKAGTDLQPVRPHRKQPPQRMDLGPAVTRADGLDPVGLRQVNVLVAGHRQLDHGSQQALDAAILAVHLHHHAGPDEPQQLHEPDEEGVAAPELVKPVRVRQGPRDGHSGGDQMAQNGRHHCLNPGGEG